MNHEKDQLSKFNSEKMAESTQNNTTEAKEPSKWKRVKEANQRTSTQEDDQGKGSKTADISKTGLDNHNKEFTAIEQGTEDSEKHTDLQKENETLRQQLEEAQKALQYAEAERQNSARRNREELSNARLYAGLDTIKAFMGLLDSLEAGNLQQEEMTIEQLKEGTRNMLDLVNTIFKKLGVTEVNSTIGELFDPNVHSAVATEPSNNSSQTSDVITKVLRKGYFLHERLIRPAMVIISQAKE